MTGPELKQLRKDAGMTMQVLADKMGWRDRMRVNELESGRNRITPAVAIAVKSILSTAQKGE